MYEKAKQKRKQFTFVSDNRLKYVSAIAYEFGLRNNKIKLETIVREKKNGKENQT